MYDSYECFDSFCTRRVDVSAGCLSGTLVTTPHHKKIKKLWRGLSRCMRAGWLLDILCPVSNNRCVFIYTHLSFLTGHDLSIYEEQNHQ